MYPLAMSLWTYYCIEVGVIVLNAKLGEPTTGDNTAVEGGCWTAGALYLRGEYSDSRLRDAVFSMVLLLTGRTFLVILWSSRSSLTFCISIRNFLALSLEWSWSLVEVAWVACLPWLLFSYSLLSRLLLSYRGTLVTLSLFWLRNFCDCTFWRLMTWFSETWVTLRPECSSY